MDKIARLSQRNCAKYRVENLANHNIYGQKIITSGEAKKRHENLAGTELLRYNKSDYYGN